jgi:hypothetical protein
VCPTKDAFYDVIVVCVDEEEFDVFVVVVVCVDEEFLQQGMKMSSAHS